MNSGARREEPLRPPLSSYDTPEAVFGAFYTSESGLALPYYHRPPNTDIGDYRSGLTETLQRGDWPADKDVEEKIKEVAMNRRILEHGGDSFDISTITDNDPRKPYMIHASTYGSSLDNPGNAWEFAVQSLLHPDYNHVYVASFGNGGSSPIPERFGQRQYVAESGRLTRQSADGNTVPLEIVTNLFRALHAERIETIRITSADSAGVGIGRGLAMVMEPGQLESAVMSGATGFKNMSAAAIAIRVAVKEQLWNSRHNGKLVKQYDTAGMTAEKADKARQIMDEYTPEEFKRSAAAHKIGLRALLGSRIVSAEGLRRGPTPESNPLLDEENALHARHPRASIRYIMGAKDSLYGGPEQTHNRAQHFVSEVDPSDVDFDIIIVPFAPHAFHTPMPELKAATAQVGRALAAA